MLTSNSLTNTNMRVKPLQHVTVALQDHDLKKMNLLKARNTFNNVMRRYEATATYLSPTAAIVECPLFESAIVKVMKGEADALTPQETRLLKKFERKDAQGINIAREITLVDNDELGKHVDLTWIPATSNACERLFSRAKIEFDDYRQLDTSSIES